ncbi:MAG: redoxin domain-containing protein [Opitutae bacterium]|nr:redoxin domain-containing protein [Opitutae bacterium]
MPPAATTVPASPKKKNSLGRLLALLVAATLWPAVWGFAAVAVGDLLDEAVLPDLDGSPHHLLAGATVNVFIFFKPGQEHSAAAIRQFAALEKEFAGKSVRWVAITSDRTPRAEAEAARLAAGIAMPVLIDAGDALFGRLGVILEPCVGLAGADRRLVAYRPFAKVNYPAVVRAEIRHLLGEIDAAELARAGNPPPATNGGPAAAAHRRLRLAEKLFQAKLYPQALENVQTSLEKDPASAPAHALRGQILAAQNQPAAALLAFARALELDPANAEALRGKAGLANPSP